MPGPIPPLSSSRTRLTNPGIPLNTDVIGGDADPLRGVLPSEWRAKLPLAVVDLPVPTDYPLFSLTDEILACTAEQKATADRMMKTVRKPAGVFQLTETFTDKYKQYGTRSRFFRFEDDFPGSFSPTANRDVKTNDFGNKHFEEVVEEVPGTFGNEQFTVERPVVTPEDFRALLKEHEYCVTSEGIAEEYTLAPGDIRAVDTQEDVFNHRLCHRFIDILDLPAQIINSKTNQFKQKVFVNRTLDLDSEFPPNPTATSDVAWTNLGDGTALTVIEATENVFEHLVSTTEIPDLLPDIFKALLASHEREFTVEDDLVDDPPTLDTGDFYRAEEQIDEFNKRVKTRGRAGISLPQSITILKKTTSEFGGGIALLKGFLDDSEPAIDEGLLVINSEVRNLGNGTWFRQTETLDDGILDAWPVLIGTEVDPRTGITVGIRKQTVDAGTEGGVMMDGSYVDIKPYDKWKSISISSKLDPATLPDPVTWETTMEHRFPNELLGVAWIWAAASAPFAYDFDMALVLDMREGYAGPCRAKITESFSEGPPADVITPTIFCPQGHMLGYSWSFAADPSEDCGTCIGIARANAKTWTIPPSLHGEIDLSGTVTLTEGEFTDTLPATCPAALPSPGSLITKACDVERWRFGVFYRRLTEIYVPDCTCV